MSLPSASKTILCPLCDRELRKYPYDESKVEYFCISASGSGKCKYLHYNLILNQDSTKFSESFCCNDYYVNQFYNHNGKEFLEIKEVRIGERQIYKLIFSAFMKINIDRNVAKTIKTILMLS